MLKSTPAMRLVIALIIVFAALFMWFISKGKILYATTTDNRLRTFMVADGRFLYMLRSQAGANHGPGTTVQGLYFGGLGFFKTYCPNGSHLWTTSVPFWLFSVGGGIAAIFAARTMVISNRNRTRS